MAFDLSTLDLTKTANDGGWLTLRHPVTDVELPIKIKLAGAESDAYKQAERDHTNRRLREMQRGGKMPSVTAESVEAQALKILATVTLDWEGVELDGAPLPFNKQNAETLYKRFAWIQRQAEAFIGDPANFTAEGAIAAIEGN